MADPVTNAGNAVAGAGRRGLSLVFNKYTLGIGLGALVIGAAATGTLPVLGTLALNGVTASASGLAHGASWASGALASVAGTVGTAVPAVEMAGVAPVL